MLKGSIHLVSYTMSLGLVPKSVCVGAHSSSSTVNLGLEKVLCPSTQQAKCMKLAESSLN